MISAVTSIIKILQNKKPPVKDRGQVNREASRLGDAGVTNPLPIPKDRNTGGQPAVIDDNVSNTSIGVEPPQNPEVRL